jgi:hypothetical protein
VTTDSDGKTTGIERNDIEGKGSSHPDPYVVLCPERIRRFGSRLLFGRSSDGRWNSEMGIEKLLLAAIKTVMARSIEVQTSRSKCKKRTRGERGTDTRIDYAAAPRSRRIVSRLNPADLEVDRRQGAFDSSALCRKQVSATREEILYHRPGAPA